MSYLLFVPVVVMSTRHGLLGAALALPLVQAGLIAGVTIFAPRVATAVEFQMLMLAMALTSIYLGLLASERERAARRLAGRERELREQREALAEAQRSAATARAVGGAGARLEPAVVGHRHLCPRGAPDCRAGRRGSGHAVPHAGPDRLESARAGNTSGGLRDFFRTGATHSEQVHAEELIDRGRAHLRDRLERSGIAFETAIEPGLPPLQHRRVQLGAVLDNLLATPATR